MIKKGMSSRKDRSSAASCGHSSLSASSNRGRRFAKRVGGTRINCIITPVPVLSVYEVIDADEIVVLACRHVRQDEVNWSHRAMTHNVRCARQGSY